jgi:hypothetical protein
MWDFISKNINLFVTLGTLAGGYIWHRLFTSTEAKRNAVVQSALDAIGGIFDQYIASASTSTSLDTMRAELRGLAAVQLGRFGIYEGTAARALLDAGVNAAIEAALAVFVQNHATPTSLHAEVKASALAPQITRIAGT